MADPPLKKPEQSQALTREAWRRQYSTSPCKSGDYEDPSLDLVRIPGMPAALIITIATMIKYIVPALPSSASTDSLVAFALASIGVVFCVVALLKITSIAWHNMSQALIRHWHFTSLFTRNPRS
jgi:hypothetical protein